jgi:hypothetical protein
MISVFIDPGVQRTTKPAILIASPVHPRSRPKPEHPLDREIVQTLEDAREPVGVWQLINAMAKSSNPANRAHARSLRQETLARINPLVRRGFVRRIGRTALTLSDKPHEAENDLHHWPNRPHPVGQAT